MEQECKKKCHSTKSEWLHGRSLQPPSCCPRGFLRFYEGTWLHDEGGGWNSSYPVSTVHTHVHHVCKQTHTEKDKPQWTVERFTKYWSQLSLSSFPFRVVNLERETKECASVPLLFSKDDRWGNFVLVTTGWEERHNLWRGKEDNWLSRTFSLCLLSLFPFRSFEDWSFSWERPAGRERISPSKFLSIQFRADKVSQGILADALPVLGGFYNHLFTFIFQKVPVFSYSKSVSGNIFILTLFSDTRAFSFHLPRLLGGFHDPSLSTDEIYGRSIVGKEGQVQLR